MINKPGSYQFDVIFDKADKYVEWIQIIDARRGGTYDLRVMAEHKTSNTKGKIIVKVLAGKGARVTVKGIIKIYKTGQGTENFLELRALTLDKTAVVTLDPELEIEANNVRASHAASVGGVDSEQQLYLQSRGLNRNQAKKIIVEGWLGV